MEFEYVTWDQVYTLLLKLANKILKDDFKADIIIGVTNGGIIPARIISDLLGISQLTMVGVRSYTGTIKNKKQPVLTQPVPMSLENKKVLVIDDIADSGTTLQFLKRYIPTLGTLATVMATIYYKRSSTVIPNWYAKETSRWIVFPWERKEMTKVLRNQPIEST